MEIHLIFYLVLSFTGVVSTLLQEDATSFCSADTRGSIHIGYNLTENGFCVTMNNLKRGMQYEVGIRNCKSGISHCQEFPKTDLLSSYNFYLNYSCVACGNQEAIYILDLVQGETVLLPINKPGCVFTEEAITSTLPSTSTDSISTTLPSISTDSISTALPSTSTDPVSTTILSTVIVRTHADPAASTRPSNNKVKVWIPILSAFLIAFIFVAGSVWYVRTKRRHKFHLSSKTERSGSSNVQGLVICCPCSKVHREATKEFLSLINNFTDLHATSYLDLRLSQEMDIPELVGQLCSKVNWMIIIESANFYHHSKEENLKEFSFCSLMARFSVQLLKHSVKIKSLKTIYRISFDLESEELEWCRLFPELNSHIYSLLRQTMNVGYCLNLDEIERLFCSLTREQLGSSDNNMRRWTNNIWKESSEAKNLEKALVNRTDELQNSSGCYLVDKTCFSAPKTANNSQPKMMFSFLGNLYGDNQTDKLEVDKYYGRPRKESDSIGTFDTHSSFEKYDLLTDNQSLMNRFPYLGNIPSGSSDISSDIISLELQRINFETDAKIRNNLLRVIEEPLDVFEQMSV